MPMENDALMVNSAPGLQDRLELGVAHEDFDWGAVEDAAGVLMESLPSAKLTRAQAEEVLRWHMNAAKAETMRAEAGMVLRMMEELMNSANVKMDVYAIALVSGISDGLGYSSQEDVARLLGVTRAAVNKVVRRWEDALRINNLKFRRNDETRKHCSDAQKDGHWRNRTAGDFARK
jgi:hypothetical protein